MHASIESDRLQRPSMALRFESLNKISRFVTFLERILVMPMHVFFLTAVCLGKVRYVRYDCNFRMLHPCNMSHSCLLQDLGMFSLAPISVSRR